MNIYKYAKLEEVEREYFDIYAVLYDDTVDLCDEGYLSLKKAEERVAYFKEADSKFPNDPYKCKDYIIKSRVEVEEELVYDFPPSDYD